ncbi:MAG: hypothetical protein EPO62_03730 [Candidatus Nitrosotenuis sp.]|nr:MAG: hypothetical protein EPO62_03730 [Candidatus Nitrosotenuis sp.]
MKFANFWTMLCKLVAQREEFSTLKRHTKFMASYHNNTILIKPEKTKLQRVIHVTEFTKVWQKAKTLSDNERFIQANYHNITFHASYILALIKLVIQNETIE